jgi:hypothetical protein
MAEFIASASDGVNQPNPDAQILAVDPAIPTNGNLTVEIQLQPGTAPAGR